MHRARPRIQFGIMLARRFVEHLGIVGKLVPETVEINAFPALYQTLGIRTPKREMPERVAARDFFPRPDAGQRRVYDDEFCDEAGIFRGERIADHIADVMRDEVD